MKERPLDKGLTVKYLQFLIDSSTQLLATGIIEYDFENIMREYAKFLHRILASNKIDGELKDKLVSLNLFDRTDLENHSNSFMEGFLSRIPFLGTLAPRADNQVKMMKIKGMKESLSQILFTIEKYSFS